MVGIQLDGSSGEVTVTDFKRPLYGRFSQVMTQAKAMITIERAIRFIIGSKTPAFKSGKRNKGAMKETGVGRRIKKILPLVGFFDEKYIYSEAPQLFIQCLRAVDSAHGGLLTKSIFDSPEYEALRAEAINALVESIRGESQSGWYRRQVSDRRYEAYQNGRSIAAYVARMLQFKAKTLIVRLDFWYAGSVNARVTIDRVIGDINALLYNRGRHAIFKGLIGYVWAVEQSTRHGFHIHACFFYDGSKVRQDISIGFAIGELWRETSISGECHVCNVHKRKLKRLGIGMILRKDAQACENAIRMAQYLVKGGDFLERRDQYLRIRPRGARVFNKGVAPDLNEKGVGRPAVPTPWEISPSGEFLPI
jgi:hypothetical protein